MTPVSLSGDGRFPFRPTGPGTTFSKEITLAQRNYKFEKRQKDLAKQKKKEEKKQRKLAKKLAGQEEDGESAGDEEETAEEDPTTD